MKLGSLFDGSGGFPLAGSLCGIEPVWAAEVEPYPIAVTRSRFPNMRHLGDISKVNGAEIEPVDVITFGSPCQDLSMAGKRAGLKHEAKGDEETTRSGLFMEAVRIIKEMRAATDGNYPRFALWENVPGAFSSNKGEDFRIVCEELIKIVEPGAFMPPVPAKGWAYADSYVGDGWSLAYRVFDAQYWGVPQRRRRIHLVVDFRGLCAKAILFEREGVRGYFAEGRPPWQTAAGNAEDSPGADDRAGEGFDRYNQCLTGDVCTTLRTPDGGDNCACVIERIRGRRLDAVGFDAYNQAVTGAVAKSLTAKRSDADHTPVVFEPIPLNTLSITHGSGGDLRRGDGIGKPGEPQFTISCGHPHAVAYSLDEKCGQTYVWENQVHTLSARDYKQPKTVCFAMQAFGKYQESDTASTLKARDYKDTTDLAVGCDAEERVRYIVRRLTPTECARLQGFADHWGHIDKKDSFTNEEYSFWLDVRNTHATINSKKVQEYTEAQMLTWYNKLHTDSSEYKMWGNGIALPPALYCMQGLVEAMDQEEDDSWLM